MKSLIDIVLIQRSVGYDIQKNIDEFSESILKLTVKNTTIVALHELSYLKYIAITKDQKNKLFAVTDNSEIINHFCDLSKSKKIYLLLPFYELCRKKFYNTTILISPTGKIVAKYRKRNIPNEPCYEENYYFSSSNNQFPIAQINGFNIGLMTCWDQWYSHSYNKLAENNADLILCPTSIGSAYNGKKCISLSDEKKKWRNIIVANSLMINTPIVIINRIGNESSNNKRIDFWGSSFITDANGEISYIADNKKNIHKHTINLLSKKKYQKLWGFK